MNKYSHREKLRQKMFHFEEFHFKKGFRQQIEAEWSFIHFNFYPLEGLLYFDIWKAHFSR